MKLYTSDELIQDFKRIEGYDFRIDVPGIRFLKLYSEHFPNKQTIDNNSIENVTQRLSKFINTRNVMLPTCDTYIEKTLH